VGSLGRPTHPRPHLMDVRCPDNPSDKARIVSQGDGHLKWARVDAERLRCMVWYTIVICNSYYNK
jgi:hypothetical protein